ncbi:MAG TPA: GTP-binding protein [Gemmataceae bacterium]|nr:GTP-binding protein [Gemmataceae bacterium]
MKRLRFVMVGGFLGAGKTTAMARLARFYQGRGQRVGLVTNDQAQDLVDTNSLRAQGFPVEEVPGACFCCKFDELMGRVGRLEANERPDVILAEPVGSCTDLVATVVQPLKDLYGDRFQVAPYAVLFKPSHGLRILRSPSPLPLSPAAGESGRGEGGGFSPKAAYIFRKQLEEADAIAINRIDELTPAAVEELAALVAREYPGTPVVRVSAKTGQNFQALTELLDQEGSFGRKILNIDYDTYAEGEAEMGWLNSSMHLSAGQPFALDEALLEVVRRLREALGGLGGEVAHLKVIGLGESSFGVANLVSSGSEPELSLPSHGRVKEADVIVNARVALDPAALEQEVRKAVTAVCQSRGVRAEFRQSQSLRPGRPTPTHRYASAV